MKKFPVIPVIVVIIILLIGGVVFAVVPKNNGPQATPTPTPNQAIIEKIPVDSLDVTFTPRSDNHAFTLGINDLKSKGYTQFEYEISYDAESTEEPGQTITQGSASKEPIAVTSENFTREILLGTCSKNVCKYDTGVKSVDVVIRLTDSQGKVKIWEKSFPL